MQEYEPVDIAIGIERTDEVLMLSLSERQEIVTNLPGRFRVHWLPQRITERDYTVSYFALTSVVTLYLIGQLAVWFFKPIVEGAGKDSYEAMKVLLARILHNQAAKAYNLYWEGSIVCELGEEQVIIRVLVSTASTADLSEEDCRKLIEQELYGLELQWPSIEADITEFSLGTKATAATHEIVKCEDGRWRIRKAENNDVRHFGF